MRMPIGQIVPKGGSEVTEVYRFRSAERLLGESQELERQTIYFASGAQLNDPVEAMRDIVWRGDRIAWANLLKNYVYCVHRAYFISRVVGPDLDFEEHGIAVEGRWDQPETPQMGELFTEIWARVSEDNYVTEFAEEIGGMERDVRLHEALSYLYAVHPRALASVQLTYGERGIGPAPDRAVLVAAMNRSRYPFAEVEDLMSQIDLDKDKREPVHEILPHLLASRFVVDRYRRRKDFGKPMGVAQRQLGSEFPALYLKQLPALLGPKWYAASFCKTYHSPAMWAHYAKNHTGACLIFDTGAVEDDLARSLHLEAAERKGLGRNERQDCRDYRFWDVKYQSRLPEVDFFRNLGTLSESVVMKLWYTDEQGNESRCASYMQDGRSMHTWRDKHWDAFYRAAFTKTRHWEYEQETRLIDYGHHSDASDGDPQLMRYDFECLKGIIFGINMSEDDKMKIIEIFERKCREKGRSGFKLSQAYYSPHYGDIRKF